ncbi:MAG: adenylate/guanylate cyclase domain-containing protein [Phormidesmis sp.]
MKTSVHPHIQRTLAAIVVTDAVGFSKRMSQDEDRALATINRDLQLISELCEFFEGKILKTLGDGVLMYFVSAVQAAACALEMQKTFASFIQAGKGSEHFTHRVGVHLGDIFVNQQDMMGTGVNIAARLESAANPGAICMSQVAYNVVKSRLDLDAVYAGELSLKNIEETVAAYHIWPAGVQTEGDIHKMLPRDDDTTQIIASPGTFSPTPFNVVLQALLTHPNSRRIKKLLYGTHKLTWENSAAVLESVSLKALLESLIDRNASLSECRQSLYQIVGTLNRQAEYAQVADLILEHLEDFYGQNCGQKYEQKIQNTEAPEKSAGALCREIANQLDQLAQRDRVRKMLYCLCNDRWENESDRLSHLPTTALVATLYQQIATSQALQNRLRAILLRLNRKATYAPIANAIFHACEVLYPSGDSPISLPSADELEDSPSEHTRLRQQKETAHHTNQWPTTPHSPIGIAALAPSGSPYSL